MERLEAEERAASIGDDWEHDDGDGAEERAAAELDARAVLICDVCDSSDCTCAPVSS